MILPLIALLMAAPGRANQYVAECVEPRYLAEKADLIVHGTVSKAEAREEKGGMISTFVTVKVDRVLKGKKPKSLTIKRLGGTVMKNGGAVSTSDGDGPWIVKPGDSGWLHLSKPAPAYYEGKYYGLVCGLGLTQEAPKL